MKDFSLFAGKWESGTFRREEKGSGLVDIVDR